MGSFKCRFSSCAILPWKESRYIAVCHNDCLELLDLMTDHWHVIINYVNNITIITQIDRRENIRESIFLRHALQLQFEDLTMQALDNRLSILATFS
jgi:hypothetical protein